MVTISDPKTIEKLRKGMGFNPFFSETKKLQPSFIFMGKKNAGKTSKVLDTFRGPMLILSFDNQTEIIVQDKIRKEKQKYGKSEIEKNVVVASFYPGEYGHIDGSGDERVLNIGYAIITDIERMFDNIRSHNIHFDYIVVDGYPEMKDRINEYMRKKATLTLTEDILGNDLRAYGYRNRFFQILVYSMFELSDICPIFTTYPKVDLSKAFKGTPPPEPEMDKNFLTLFRNIVWIERTVEETKNKKKVIRFYANLQSMKGVDFGEEGTTYDVTGDKPVFPVEKLEAYRKGNPLNPVESPVSRTNIDDIIPAEPDSEEDNSLLGETKESEQSVAKTPEKEDDDLLGDL